MTLTAMVLAGGSSRRMGSDKALLSVHSQPLWDRQLRLLHALAPDAAWVSARSKPAWCPPKVPFVADAPPSRGPLSGLSAGLGRLRTSHLLVLAIDLPCMSEEHLRALVELAQPGKGVIPVNGDFYEPLCAIYPVESAAFAQAALRSDDVSLQRFVEVLLHKCLVRPYFVRPAERQLYHNLNHPSDLDAAGLAPSERSKPPAKTPYSKL